MNGPTATLAMKDVIFHGLLFVEGSERHVNLRSAGDPIDVYARCAAACARSLTETGHAFRLITNERARLAARFAALNLAVPQMVEHRFTLDVPPMPFRSAHHKLELFRAFADGGFGETLALIDIDMLMLRPLPLPAIAPATLYGYDITAQVLPEFSADRVARDIAMVAGRPSASPQWWGGEFLLGDRAAFRSLADAVEACWPRYLAARDMLHHHGDEMVTNAALSLLADAGHVPVDLGGAGVQRWWSARTRFRQHATLVDALTTALIHLPADKPLLGRFADATRPLAAFPRACRRHIRRKLALRHLLSLAERLTAKRRKHVARLG